MKLDKDTLVKQRFWIVLIAAATLTLIGWVLLLVTVPSAVGKEKSRVEKIWNNNKNVTQFKGKDWVEQEQHVADEYKASLTKVNKDLFRDQATQATVMSWPPGMEKYDFLNGLYASEVSFPAVKKGASKAEIIKGLPKDTPKQMHGILASADSEWFSIEDRDGKPHKFYRTNKIKIVDSNPKDKMVFGRLSLRIGQPVQVTYIKGKYFGEDFTLLEIESYTNAYQNQLHDVLATLGPVNVLNETVVQLRQPGGAGLDVVNECWVYDKTKLPPQSNRFFPWTFWPNDARNVMSDEVWAAQETVWVQRELFKQMKAANDSLVVCERVGKDGKSAIFKNYYWQVTLAINGNEISAQLKNLRPEKQNIDNLHFLLTFKDQNDKNAAPSEPVLFPPKGKTFEANSVGLAGGGNDVFPAKGAKSFAMPGVTLKDMDLHSVVQVQTVDTAAIKRLDVINIAASSTGEMAVSHREGLQKALVAFNAKTAPLAPVVQKAPDPDEKTPPPDVAPEEVSNADVVKKFTPNKILLERYLEKTKAGARRLPVCIVMVVGPDHIGRVQAHLVSSPLRFLETQVFLQRAVLTSGLIKSSGASTPSVVGSGGATKTGRGGGLGDSLENVELTVYGVVTLYDRPERPGSQ